VTDKVTNTYSGCPIVSDYDQETGRGIHEVMGDGGELVGKADNLSEALQLAKKYRRDKEGAVAPEAAEDV
jgi:hypothetical protein